MASLTVSISFEFKIAFERLSARPEVTDPTSDAHPLSARDNVKKDKIASCLKFLFISSPCFDSIEAARLNCFYLTERPDSMKY
jgi:hypothetical protein